MMSGECVFGCRHPLWGGSGECITADDPAVDDSCVCDARYASRDSFGNPSCEPFHVLVGLFTMVALVGTMTTALVLWHLAHHFLGQKQSARVSRKAVVRLRLMISSSLSSGGVLVVFWVAVARGGTVPLWDGWEFYIMFGLTYSSGIFATTQIGELWLDHLPQPLVKPGSMLAKMKTLAKEQDALFWNGLVSSGAVFVASMLSLVFGQREVRHVLHIIMGVTTIMAAIGFISVASFLTRAINKASAKSPQSWHSRAKRNIRVEAGVLTVACTVYTVAVLMLELTYAGGSTPLIPFAAMLIVSGLGQTAVVHTSKPSKPAGGGRPAGSPNSAFVSSMLSQLGSPRASTVFGNFSPRIKKALGREDGGAVAPQKTLIGRPMDWPRASGSATKGAAKNKVIPAVSEDPDLPLAIESSQTEPLAKSGSLPC